MMQNRGPLFRCGVYANSKFTSIETVSGYGIGFGDHRGVETRLDPDADKQALGEAVLSALAKSCFILPTEDPDLFDMAKARVRYDKWVAEVMTAYGYRTRGTLFKGMLHCSVDVIEGQMTISPSKRLRGEGFGPTLRGKQDHVHLPANSTPEEIGAALRLALSRCV